MIQQLFHLMNNENLRLKTEKLSFAAPKNDMLLRNMIFRLNVEMIGSTSSNMICLASPNVVVCFTRIRMVRVFPVVILNVDVWGSGQGTVPSPDCIGFLAQN